MPRVTPELLETAQKRILKELGRESWFQGVGMSPDGAMLVVQIREPRVGLKQRIATPAGEVPFRVIVVGAVRARADRPAVERSAEAEEARMEQLRLEYEALK